LNDDDEQDGNTVASFHTFKFQPIQAKKRTVMVVNQMNDFNTKLAPL